jgi:hypothetical protein
VREERLKAAAGVSGAIHLSSWRGRSGRRYVVGIHPFSGTDGLDVTEAVLIAVRRDADGTAQVIDVAAAGSKPRDAKRTAWIAHARERGAAELHVHRLAETDDERRAIVEDLRGEDESIGGPTASNLHGI